jgi:hypothetical protein
MSKGGNNNNFYYDENLISLDDAYQGFNNYNNNNNLNNFNDFELYNNLNRDDPFLNDNKNLNTNNINNYNKNFSQNNSLRTSKTNSVNNSIKSISNSNNSLKSTNNSTNNSNISNRDSGGAKKNNNTNKMNNNSNRLAPRNGQAGGPQPPPKNFNTNGYHGEINGNKNTNNNHNKPVNNRLKPLNQNNNEIRDSYEMIDENPSRQPMTKNSNKSLKQPAQQQQQPQPGAKPVKNLQIIDNDELNHNGQQNSNVKLPKSNNLRLNNFEVNAEPKKNLELKTRNNQSSFAKNPTNSYSLQYYGSFPQNVIKPKFKVPPFIEGLSPRELVYNYPYMLPAAAPIIAPIPIPAAYAPLPYHRYNNKKEVAPKVDTHLHKNNNNNKYNDKKNQFNTTDYLYNYYPYPSPYSEYYSPAGILPYNIYIKPDYPNDDKDPSIHELLYYDSQRNKDGLHLQLFLFDLRFFTTFLLNMYINSFLCYKTHREKD